MSSLLKFIAVSVGGGFALGAGISVGESLARRTSEPDARRNSTRDRADLDTQPLTSKPSRSPAGNMEKATVIGIDERLARLEAGLASHGAVLNNLESITVENERRMQRLLGTLERLAPVGPQSTTESRNRMAVVHNPAARTGSAA